MKRILKMLAIALSFALVAGLVSLAPIESRADDTRTEVTRVVATSNIAPEYAAYVPLAPEFTFSEGTQARMAASMGRWKRKNGDEWELYNGLRFIDGTYRFETQLRIDGDYGTTHKLSDSVYVEIDGVEWSRAHDVGVYDTYSYVTIVSPEYAVDKVDMDLSFEDSYRYDIWITYVGTPMQSYSVATAVIGGETPYTFSKVSGPDWITVSEDGMVSGTPTEPSDNGEMVIRVTDAAGDYKQIKVSVAESYPDPADRETVSTVVATSDINPKYAQPMQGAYNFNFTEGGEAYIVGSMGRWWKKDGEEWVQSTENNFTEGVYCFHTQLRIDDKNGSLYKLDVDNLSVTIDGVEWTCDQVRIEKTYSYVFISSPEYTIEKPDVTELIFWDKDEFDIPISYAGVAITSYSVASAVEGGLEPYVFEKTSGPSWINVSEDGTVSGTPTEQTTYGSNFSVCVTDLLGSEKEIVIYADLTYPAPENRVNITEIVATSSLVEPAAGANVTNVEFVVEGENCARFTSGAERGWYVLDGEEWIKYEALTFEDGTYRYQNTVAVDGAFGNRYKFNDALTVTVDGEAWTVSDIVIENASSTATVVSKTFEVHTHRFDGEWQKSGDKHWKECACGEKAQEAEHSYNGEWQKTDAKHWKECECGQKAQEAEHSYNGEWQKSGDKHWKECACGEKAQEAEHSYDGEWQKSGDKHWKECACGEKEQEGTHADSDADGACDTCGYVEGSSDNVGGDQNNTDSDGMPVGAVVAIVIAGVILLGAGGFALVWFVIRKKSFSELIAVFKKK